MKSVNTMTEDSVKMAVSAQKTILTKFVKIQTALMTTAKAGTQIHANMKIDVDLT